MGMAGGAVSGKLSRQVVWVGGLVVVRDMATCTGIGGVGIASLVAGGTIISDSGMGSFDFVELVV